MPQRYSARGALNLPGPPGRPGHPQVWHPDFDSRQNKVPLHLQVFLFPNAMRHRVVSCFVKPRALRFQRHRSHRIRLRGVCLFFLGRLTDWLVVYLSNLNYSSPPFIVILVSGSAPRFNARSPSPPSPLRFFYFSHFSHSNFFLDENYQKLPFSL